MIVRVVVETTLLVEVSDELTEDEAESEAEQIVWDAFAERDTLLGKIPASEKTCLEKVDEVDPNIVTVAILRED